MALPAKALAVLCGLAACAALAAWVRSPRTLIRRVSHRLPGPVPCTWAPATARLATHRAESSARTGATRLCELRDDGELVFACAGGGELVDASLLDDGICDCADGSDEALPCAAAARPLVATAAYTPAAPPPADACAARAALVATAQQRLAEMTRDAASLEHEAEAAGAAAGASADDPMAQQRAGHASRQAAQRAGQLRRMLAMDYGAEDAYLALGGECVRLKGCTGPCSSHNADVRVHELCFFAHASQSGSGGGRRTHLGSFAGWASVHAPTRVSPLAPPGVARQAQVYAHGEPCWQGPERSALVEFACANQTRLAAVDEDGKCTYALLVETPAACAPCAPAAPPAERENAGRDSAGAQPSSPAPRA